MAQYTFLSKHFHLIIVGSFFFFMNTKKSKSFIWKDPPDRTFLLLSLLF